MTGLCRPEATSVLVEIYLHRLLRVFWKVLPLVEEGVVLVAM